MSTDKKKARGAHVFHTPGEYNDLRAIENMDWWWDWQELPVFQVFSNLIDDYIQILEALTSIADINWLGNRDRFPRDDTEVRASNRRR